MFSLMLNTKLFPILLKGEDSLWNISFRLFHETQFNAFFITFNLISWNSYNICKRETSTNHRKQKMPYPHFATSPWSGHWLTCFSWKSYFHRRLFFSHIVLPEIKTGLFTIEFRQFWALNNFRAGALCRRIFKYSTEHPKVPGNLQIAIC